MSTPDDSRKRLQSASPEKQTGVCHHDRKRRITMSDPPSDMEESENEQPTLLTSSPLAIPSPLNRREESDSHNWYCDGKDDTTMVDSPPPPSPIPLTNRPWQHPHATGKPYQEGRPSMDH
ncbi:hypothetical protein H2248_000257 [Termitomyces sp. 'cryptogamus']|nr:hypothetical protein H2248_000257 [Termitomyces sp. 'cryptogamus']